MTGLIRWGLYAAPFVLILAISFSRDYFYPQLPLESFGLVHWMRLSFAGNDLIRAGLRSLSVAITVASLATALGFLLSRSLAYARWSRLTRKLAYLPFLLTPVIFAVLMQYYLVKLGLIGHFAGVALAQFCIVFPYAFLFFGGFWNAQLRALEALISTLGGGRWQRLRFALLPLARGPLTTCFFQCFLISWFEFGLTRLIGLGQFKTLTIMVFQYIFEANLGLAAVSSTLMIIPPLLLLWINKRVLLKSARDVTG